MTNRTKIVATIGPASREPAVLRQLIAAGVNVFRLNFSHGTHDEHSAVLADIRRVSREMDRHVAVLQDLCGPKMRLEAVAGDVLDCHLHDEFTIVTGTPANARELACSYRDLPNDLGIGDTVLFADGTVAMTVIESAPGRARMRVTLPGHVRSRQGLNLPGTDLAVSSLTDKDLHDLDWTAQHADEIDFVALSFVRQARDVEGLRRELQSRKCTAEIVVKIEKPQAVLQLDAIVAVTDAVMVARGDLGVEVDVQRVPAIQKRIITACNQAHRPVITATQMLNSMEHSSRPTRAEASDVFNAVLDGTDAVMLSGESAIGDYPVEAVTTMRHICSEAETYLKSAGGQRRDAAAPLSGLIDSTMEACVDAASRMTRQLDAALIVVSAASGRAARALANRRPGAPILALPPTEQMARRLSLCWGVIAAVYSESVTTERSLLYGIEWAKSRGLVAPGQHAILLADHVGDRRDVGAVLAGAVS
ncbi:MAG TPA: pyruvate kinase [Vicinamibacterales bacterium]|nr:pyruvate kinase [Vicinamibacterales bacterium]